MTATSTATFPGSIVPPRVGRALLLVCWLSVIYGTAAVVPRIGSARGIAAWISTVVFLGAFTLAVERPPAELLLPVAGLSAVAMQYLAPSNGAFVAVVATIAVAGIRLEGRAGRLAAGLSAVGFLVASARSPHPLASEQIVAVVPGLLFTYLGATAVRRLRIERQRTEELLAEVVAGRDARVRAAALDERARLAREMHDVLAHTLSALTIQLEGTQLLAGQRGADPAVVTALERSGRLAREGFAEARRAVSSLRGEGLPGPDLFPHLAGEFEDDTGVPCRFQIEGQPRDLGAEARLALYRIVQEALTNVRKHAAATAVTITLRYRADGGELIVEDEGRPLAAPLPGGGFGLSGMRERAELLGGQLEAGPTERGFRVRVWIPASGPSAS